MNFALFLSIDVVVSGSISFKIYFFFTFLKKRCMKIKHKLHRLFSEFCFYVACNLWDVIPKKQLFPEDFVRKEERKKC